MACQVDEFSFTSFENMEYKSEKYSDSVLNSFQKFRQSSEFCDVELISKDTVVKAHRVVLAAACVYFKALFNAGLEECQKGSVSLPTIQPDVLQLIIEFIYTGKVQITRSTVQDLISAADMLQLGELTAGCTEYLKMHLHPSNALGIFRFAETHNCTELANAALEYTQAHWVDVAKGEEVLEAPSPLFIRLLSSDKLGIDSEDEVLRSALRWLEHEPESRKQHCVEVLRRVRLRLVGPHAFEDALNSVRDPYITGILDAFRAVLEPPAPRVRVRRSLLVVGGVRDSPGQNRVELATTLKFDTHKRVWEQMASMNSPRYSLCVATAGGLLYAVGGNNGYGVLASAEVYNPSTNKWTVIASMKRPRQSFGLVAIGRKLYAFGGMGDSRMEASVEVYDPEVDKWSVTDDMPEARYEMSVVSYNGAVYVLGGCTRLQRCANDLLRYDPMKNEWRRLRPLRHARTCPAAAVFDSRLYVVGGATSSPEDLVAISAVERYHFETDEWEDIESIREARAGCAASAADGVLLVAGGHRGPYFNDVSTDAVALYDDWQRRWLEGPPLPHPRGSAAAGVL